MNDYYKIATIVVRGVALSFLVSALSEFGMAAFDFILVRTAVFNRTQIAFEVRMMEAACWIIAAAILYFKSDPIVRYVVEGLTDEESTEKVDEEQSAAETKDTTDILT